jgi:hypothetical protein
MGTRLFTNPPAPAAPAPALFRPPPAPDPRVVPAPDDSPPGADVDEVVSGDLVASEWGIAVAADLAELHAKIDGGGGVVAVESVNGHVGIVVLDKADVGLGNVDNTADVSKPLSAYQAAADALRVAKVGDTMSGRLYLNAGLSIGAVDGLPDGGEVWVYRNVYIENGANLNISGAGSAVDISDAPVRLYGAATLRLAADPVFPLDAASKQYVDANAGGGGSGVTDGDKGDILVSGTGASWMLDSAVVTAAARTVLDDVSTTAMRTTLGLGNVDNTSDANKPVSTAQAAADATKQPLDADLTTIAGLAATTDNVIQSVGSAWASRTPAQVKATLALTKSDVGLGSVDNTADASKPVSTAQAAADALKADKTTSIATTAPLTGGGDLSASRTLAVNTFGAAQAGVVPLSGGGTANFLRADGVWAPPPASGGGGGLPTTGGTMTGPLVIDVDQAIDLLDEQHALTVGDPDGNNIAIDTYQIQSRRGSTDTPAALTLQELGGDLFLCTPSTTAFVNGKAHVGGEVEVDGALNHDGTTVGFYGTTPVARPSAVTARAALEALGLGTSLASELSVPLTVAQGGSGRVTATTAYGLLAAGTTATGAEQTIAPGTSGHLLVSGGASALAAFRAGAKADVGLANVDNTTDAAKPVSTATQTALNAKLASTFTLAQLNTAVTDADVPAALNGLVGVWKGTQAQYTALGTWDANTLYAVTA